MLRTARRALAMLAAFGLVALTLLACVQPPALVIETSTGDVVRLESWTATLSSPSAGLRGSATLAPGASYKESLATLSLTGAAPGAVHLWSVQLGECGHEMGILAGPQAYTPITTDARGEGRATAVLPFTVPTEGLYSVSVRQSETAPAPVVACGNLTKYPPPGAPAIAEARAP